MRNRLVRSYLDRDVVVKGKSYLVRSPKVHEALCIVATADGAGKGEPVQKQVFFETLEGWLPRKLIRIFKRGGLPMERVVALVFSIVNQGVPNFTEENRLVPDAGRLLKGHEALQIDWENVVAEYMFAYGMSFREVMNEPWNSFLLLSRKADMVQSRASIRAITVQSIPNIQDKRQREEAMESLIRRAGGYVETPEEKRERLLAMQQAQLDKLAAQFGAAGMFVGSEERQKIAEA